MKVPRYCLFFLSVVMLLSHPLKTASEKNSNEIYWAIENVQSMPYMPYGQLETVLVVG